MIAQKVLQEGDRANSWVDLLMIQGFLGPLPVQGPALLPLMKVLSVCSKVSYSRTVALELWPPLRL